MVGPHSKIVAMIPARIGSKRVPNKNLRLLAGKPLIQYIIDTAVQVNRFSAIYLNADDDVFRPLAENSGINFYLRPKELGSDSATNDQFALDFLQNVDCDVLIQLLPTSPFLTVDDVERFIETMVTGDVETLVSVEHIQIACLYNGTPINFKQEVKNPPSQEMTPILSYATALMGWTSRSFQENMRTRGSAYHGSAGKTGYFELRGLSTIDIDREDDFAVADAIMRGRAAGQDSAARRRNDREWAEVDVPSILSKDGVLDNDLHQANKPVVNVDDLIATKSAAGASWSYRAINTESNSMTIISQRPGEGNREHYHPTWNEWWLILAGSWKWIIEGVETIVKKGDIVFIPKGTVHRIEAIGDRPAIRMAVSRADVEHVYTK